MNTLVFLMLANVLQAASPETSRASGFTALPINLSGAVLMQSAATEVGRRLLIGELPRDKRGTDRQSQKELTSQSIAVQHFARCRNLQAEGMGFEPTTHCWASDFESDRWPIRLPSSELKSYPVCHGVAT